MEVKNIFFILLCWIIPFSNLANAADLKLKIEFEFTPPTDRTPEGFNFYQNGVLIHTTTDPATREVTFSIEPNTGDYEITMNPFYKDEIEEAPLSDAFPLTYKSRIISYAWDPVPSTTDIAGYRMYMNDTELCYTLNPQAISLSCFADLINAKMDFTLVSFNSNNEESLKSNFLSFDPSVVSLPPAPLPLSAIFEASPTSGLTPLAVEFDATKSSGEISQYQWDFGDGDTKTGATQTHIYTIPGTYLASLEVLSLDGSTATKTVSITSEENSSTFTPPTAIIISSTAAGNAPLQVDFDGSSSTTQNQSIVNYEWSFGDGTIFSGVSSSHTYNIEGTYNSELKVTDNLGLSDSEKTPVVVATAIDSTTSPISKFTATPSQGNTPLIVTFDASSSFDSDGTITNYTWDFGDGTSSTGPLVQHTYVDTAVYSVTLQTIDNTGESSTYTRDIHTITNLQETALIYDIGEIEIDHNWAQIVLENSFNNPAVIIGPPTTNGIDPIVVRLNNVTGQGFDVRLQEWDYLDGEHEMEQINYLVLEQGLSILQDGTKIEVGTFSAGSPEEAIALQHSFENPPIIFTSIQSAMGNEAVTGHVTSVTSNYFSFKLNEQEANQQDHATETVAYLAWTPGAGSDGQISYESNVIADSATHDWLQVTLQNVFNSAPFIFTNIQSGNEKDTVTTRYRNQTTSGFEIKLEEEASYDQETNHQAETIAYLALGSQFSSEETIAKKIDFTWDFFGDQQTINGFKFYLNGMSICETSNPADRQISCQASLNGSYNEFSMKSYSADGTESFLSNVLPLKEVFITDSSVTYRTTFTWEFDESQENNITGFRIYNNSTAICEVYEPTSRQISCTTTLLEGSNMFTVTAIQPTDTETDQSNGIEYTP